MVGLVLPHGFCVQPIMAEQAAGATAAGHVVSAATRQRQMEAGVPPAPLSSFCSVWDPAYESGIMPIKSGSFHLMEIPLENLPDMGVGDLKSSWQQRVTISPSPQPCVFPYRTHGILQT